MGDRSGFYGTCSEKIHANCMGLDFDVVPTINNHKEIAEVKRCVIHTPFLQMLIYAQAYVPSKVQDISIYHTTNHHCTILCRSKEESGHCVFRLHSV